MPSMRQKLGQKTFEPHKYRKGKRTRRVVEERRMGLSKANKTTGDLQASQLKSG